MPTQVFKPFFGLVAQLFNQTHDVRLVINFSYLEVVKYLRLHINLDKHKVQSENWCDFRGVKYCIERRIRKLRHAYHIL